MTLFGNKLQKGLGFSIFGCITFYLLILLEMRSMITDMFCMVFAIIGVIFMVLWDGS